MTRQEAIEIIEQDIPCEHDTDLIEALCMAIEALEQEPSEDCISRADLQELFNETTTSLMDKIEQKDIEHLVRACVMVTEMIQDAPSVVPKRGEPIITCKDCKHHGTSNCPMWGDDTTEDYMWCCDGERMESDTE